MAVAVEVFLLVAACTLAATIAQPTTVRFADVSKMYNSSQPEAYAGFAELMYPLTGVAAAQPPANPEAPQQVLVTYQAPDEVMITWFTGKPQTTSGSAGAKVPGAEGRGENVVSYGSSRGSLKKQATASTDYYTQDYNISPALNISGISDAQYNYTSGLMHCARLRNLKPNTRYYYTLGTNRTVRSFKTAPSVSRFPFKLGHLADIAISVNSTETIRKLGLEEPDLVLLNGDFAYANIFDFNGALGYSAILTKGVLFSQQSRWDTLGRILEPLVSRVPTLASQGNHEMELQLDGSMFKSWLTRYGSNLPYAKSRGTPFYYSANVGPMHLVVLSPYVDFVTGTPQYDWLVRDLSSVDRAVTPWVVAMWHAPWYHTLVSHFKELECHRLAVEPLLYKYGVNIALHGHVHAYERSAKVYNYLPDGCGTTYITAGNSGVGLNTEFADSASLTRFSRASSYDNSTNCTRPLTTSALLVYVAGGKICNTTDPVSGKYCPNSQPTWSAYREAAHGFVTLDFESPTRAVLKYFRNLAADRQPIETVPITRDLSCPNQARKSRAMERQMRAVHSSVHSESL